MHAAQVIRRFRSVSRPYKIPSTPSLSRGIGVASQVLIRFLVRSQLSSQSRFLSLLLAKSSPVYLFLPLRGHKPPSTFRHCLNRHLYNIYLSIYLSISLSIIYLCLQRRRFPTPRYAKRPDVAEYVVDPLFLLPTPPPEHCSAPSRFPDMIHSGNRPPLIIRISAPTHKSHLVRNVFSMLSHLVISSVMMSIIGNGSK